MEFELETLRCKIQEKVKNMLRAMSGGDTQRTYNSKETVSDFIYSNLLKNYKYITNFNEQTSQ